MTPQSFHTDQQSESTFHLRSFIQQFIWRYWYLYAILPLLACVFAFLYLRYEVPVFNVQASLLIKTTPSEEDINEELVFQDLGISNVRRNLQNEIQIMRSRSLMVKVVDTLDLNHAFYLEGRVQNTELYGNSPVSVDSAVPNSAAYVSILQLRPVDDNRFEFGVEGKMQEFIFGLPFTCAYGKFQFSYNPLSFICQS